jgi:hypothetical protein
MINICPSSGIGPLSHSPPGSPHGTMDLPITAESGFTVCVVIWRMSREFTLPLSPCLAPCVARARCPLNTCRLGSRVSQQRPRRHPRGRPGRVKGVDGSSLCKHWKDTIVHPIRVRVCVHVCTRACSHPLFSCGGIITSLSPVSAQSLSRTPDSRSPASHWTFQWLGATSWRSGFKTQMLRSQGLGWIPAPALSKPLNHLEPPFSFLEKEG